MEVRFKIETLGYIVAEFLLEEEKIKIGHSSDYGDKFQELLNKFFYIYELLRDQDTKYFPYETEVLWEDDFINYQWNVGIHSADSPIKISVNEIAPFNPEHKIELVNHNIQKDKLFDSIFLSLDQTLAEFGFLGYKKNWEVGNFPIYEYIVLKAEKGNIFLEKNEDLTNENWKQKINLEDELKIIRN